MDKYWYKSRGVWLGILTSTIGTLQLVVELISSQTVSLEGVALMLIGVAKIWERFTRDIKTI